MNKSDYLRIEKYWHKSALRAIKNHHAAQTEKFKNFWLEDYNFSVELARKAGNMARNKDVFTCG